MANEAKNPTVKEVQAKQKSDESWKREPWIGDDGFEYRVQRVQNKDGSFTVLKVRVGRKPRIDPKELKT